MSKRLWLFFYGYLIIRVKGVTPERLFSILLQERVEVWEVRDQEDSLTFHVARSDGEQLEESLKAMNCPYSVVREVGLPFFLTSIKERTLLFAGLLTLLLLFYTLSSFIWFVDIEGLENLQEEEFYHLLGHVGLLPGTFRGHLDLQGMEKDILKLEPRIAWVNIELIGSMARVHLLEKVTIDREERDGIYSRRDAIITKLIPLKGQALVEEGDVVLEGDLLIRGDEKRGEARAIVWGYTWYEGYGYSSIRERLELLTGNYSTSYTLSLPMGWTFHLQGPVGPPFEEYRLESKSYLINLGRNPYLPIEIMRNEYRELLTFYSLRTSSMAKTLAQEEALRRIVEEINEGARIISTTTNLLEENDAGVGVHLLLMVEESIVDEREGS